MLHLSQCSVRNDQLLRLRLIGKAILCMARDDVQRTAGSLQLCVGQEAACEAVVHTMRSAFGDEGIEAILLVDASNAFNTLNRQAAPRNVQNSAPFLLQFLSTHTATMLRCT